MSEALRWFWWVARAEGLSVLALFGVAMPLKYGLGIAEPVAWVGWAHGVFVFVYLIALGSVSRVEGWSYLRTALAFVASFFPFGTFVLEWRLKDGAGR